MWVKLVWKPWISPNLMFPPRRCSLLLLIQPPSVVACLWVSAFSFVLPESTHCWTSKTILFPRLIRSHCKVVPKQFCNWEYSPVHFTLLLLSTVKSSVHTSKPLPLADIFAPCNTWWTLDHGLFFLSPYFIHHKRWIQTTVKAFLGKVLPVLECNQAFAPCAFTCSGGVF